MAIAASYVVSGTATGTTVASQLYTVPASTASTYAYARDLVVTNAGTNAIFVGLSTAGSVATSVASFQVPAGGSVLLYECQVPSGAILSALSGTATAGKISVGYGSVVSVV